jgi:hypothetical protein
MAFPGLGCADPGTGSREGLHRRDVLSLSKEWLTVAEVTRLRLSLGSR